MLDRPWLDPQTLSPLNPICERNIPMNPTQPQDIQDPISNSCFYHMASHNIRHPIVGWSQNPSTDTPWAVHIKSLVASWMFIPWEDHWVGLQTPKPVPIKTN